MNDNLTKGIASLFGALTYLAGLAIIATLIWLLWNILVPTITGWSEITWFQALGIRVLVSLCSFSIKTTAEFKIERDSTEDSNNASETEGNNSEFFTDNGAKSISAKKDDDGGYTIKIDFSGSHDDEDEDEDDE